MRTLKPDTLAYLYKVLNSEQGMVLCSTVLAGFVFDESPESRLISEQDLWKMTTSVMGEDEVLDWSFPKSEAEYLVYGSCHLQRPAQAAQVRVKVAEKTKTLDVYGHRTWQGSFPGDPEPFSVMPIAWNHAYGGPDFPENPLGKGRPSADGQPIPVPNIFPEGVVAQAPDQPCPPAGLTAMQPHWPQRLKYFGPFNRDWLTTRWPYYPKGTTMHYCMTAPEDQRMGRFFNGDERIAVNNMHPDAPLLETSLPPVRIRFFLNRLKAGEETFSERPCMTDTLWLFPERAAGIVAYRNLTLISDEEAADVRHCLIAVEPLRSAPLSVEHYKNQLAETLSPPPEEAPAPAAPPQEAAPAPPPPPPPTEEPSDALKELEAAVAELEAQTNANLAKLGVTREEAEAYARSSTAKPPTERIEELIDTYKSPADADPEKDMQELEAMVGNMEKQAQEQLAALGVTPEQAERFLAEKMNVPAGDPVAAIDAMLALPNLDPEARAKFEEARQGFVAMNKAMADMEKQQTAKSAEEPPRQEQTPPAETFTVEKALERHARGESLATLDMRGFDFSGRDVSGADFSRCRLEGALFTGTTVAGANFSEARLDGARFDKALAAQASFEGCLGSKAAFNGADVSAADFSRADMTEADFSNANLQGAKAEAATFCQANLSGANAQGITADRGDFSQANLDGADLRQAVLEDADLTGAVCTGADFRQCHAPRLRLAGARCAGARFKEAMLHNLRADAETDLTGADLRAADLTLAAMEGVQLAKADLKRATLATANLSRATLTGARLRKADARGGRFDKADCTAADMTKVNGFKSSFRKAILTDCTMKKANLYGADLYKCVMGQTLLDGANCSRTILDPRLANYDG